MRLASGLHWLSRFLNNDIQFPMQCENLVLFKSFVQLVLSKVFLFIRIVWRVFGKNIKENARCDYLN